MTYGEYSARKTEEYYAILTKNITQIEQDYLTPKISIYKSAFSIIIYGAITFFYNKVMFFVILSLSLCVVLLPKAFKEKLNFFASGYIRQNEKYANIVNELLKAFDMLDSKVRESFIKKFSSETESLNQKRMDYGSVKVATNLISGGLIMVLEMVVLLISAYLAMKKLISLGEVVMFFSYSKSFTDPLTEILYCINTINSTEDIRKELNDFLGKEDQKQEEKDLFIDGKLVLDGLEVTYPGKKYIYTCAFNEGGKYIIFGESGSGKSTLLKLLAGKLSNSGGLSPALNYSADRIAYLSQDQIIFSDDFYNNVTLYGAYDYDEDFVRVNYEEKYLDLEDVSIMSGGERQKIKLGRALLQAKELVILDEPTTGMDDGAGKKVMDLLACLDSTVIVVTHNLSLVDKENRSLLPIDEIMSLDDFS